MSNYIRYEKYYFQVTPEDAIFLEFYSQYDLRIYLLNPGDEIFAPMNVWPINPQEMKLDTKYEYIQIELTKGKKVTNNEECNNSLTYAYGGKI